MSEMSTDLAYSAEARREAAAQAQAELERILRNAEAARVARLKTVFIDYKNAISPIQVPSASADLRQENVTIDLDALHDARYTAISTQDTAQIGLLFGADDITPIAQTLHRTHLSLCLKLYAIALEHVRQQWQAAIANSSDEATALTSITEATEAKRNTLSLQAALKAATEGTNIVLPSRLAAFITAKTVIEHPLDILDLSFQYFRQQAVNPLVADAYRINPSLEVNFEATQRRLQIASSANYQQRKLAYFEQHPEQRAVIEQQRLFTTANIPISSEHIHQAWQHYRTVRPENKSAALTVLSTVLKHSQVPVDLYELRRCQGDYSLLAMLFSHYVPRNNQEFGIQAVILDYCQKGEGSLAEWDQLALSVQVGLSKILALEKQTLIAQPRFERRSGLMDQIYLHNHASQSLTASKQNPLLTRWYAQALRYEAPIIRHDTLKSTVSPVVLPVWGNQITPQDTIRIHAIKDCLAKTLNIDIAEFKKEAQQKIAHLDVLLGPRSVKAQARGAQWFYSPLNNFHRQRYWLLLSISQRLFQAELTKKNEVAAWQKLYAFNKSNGLEQTRVRIALQTLVQTHCEAFPELREAAEQWLSTHIWPRGKFIKPLLDMVESAYQACIIPGNALSLAAATLWPEEYSQAALEQISIAEEQRDYQRRVATYLMTCSVIEFNAIIEAFSLTVPALSVNTTEYERAELAEKIANTLSTEHTQQLSFDGLGLALMATPMIGAPAQIAAALAARGAILTSKWHSSTEIVNWTALQEALNCYRPRSAQDEFFRAKITTYAQKVHHLERWGMLVKALSDTYLDDAQSFFDQAREQTKSLERFFGYGFDVELLAIAKACAKLPVDKTPVLFAVLADYLVNVGAEPSVPDAHAATVLPKASEPKILEEFTRWCRTVSSVKAMDCRGVALDVDHAYLLFNALYTNHATLTTLILEGQLLGREKAPDFMASSDPLGYFLRFLTYYDQLDHLSLANTSLRDTDLILVLKALRANTRLKVLDLSNNFLTDAGLVLLADYCEYWPELTTLNLSGNLCIDPDATAFATIFLRCPKLATIEWRNSRADSQQLRDDCLRNQASTPVSTWQSLLTVIHLPFSWKSEDFPTVFDDDEASRNARAPEVVPIVGATASIFERYVNNRQLFLPVTTFALATPAIKEEFLKWLVATSRDFTHINLDSQVFTDEEFTELCQLLSSFGHLTELSLRNSQLSTISSALNTLEIRKIAPLSDKIAQLTRAENNFFALTRLDLTDNILGKADFVALLELISRRGSRITKLSRDIDDSGTENKHRQIRDQLAKNQKNPNNALAPQRSALQTFGNSLAFWGSAEQENRATRVVQTAEPVSANSPTSAISTDHLPATFVEATYYHLVSQNVRELTFCFGKATVNGVEVDYDQLFKDQVDYFIGDVNNFPANADKPRRLAYYETLKYQLENKLKASNIASSGLFNLVAGSMSAAVGAVSDGLASAFPLTAPVTSAVKSTAEQVDQFKQQIAYKQIAAFLFDVDNDIFLKKILAKMAYITTLRYLSDCRDYILSEEKAVEDAKSIVDFIGRSHIKVDPMIKITHGTTSCVAYKADCLMEELFGSPELVLGLTTQQKKAYKDLTSRSVWVTKTPALIPLPLYASEARFYFDKEIKPEYSTLARRFRQAILHVTNHYQKSYRDLGIFQRAFIQFFTIHGGNHSISQCKQLENMAKQEEFNALLTKLISFLTVNKSLSGLRKDSLHTYLVQVFNHIAKDEPLWQQAIADAVLALTLAPTITHRPLHADTQDPPCATSSKAVTWLSTISNTVGATKDQVENLLYQERPVRINEREKMTEVLNQIRLSVTTVI